MTLEQLAQKSKAASTAIMNADTNKGRQNRRPLFA